MISYYVNQSTQIGGEHEVHAAGCEWIPVPRKRLYLGDFTNLDDAILEARRHYAQVSECHHCAERVMAGSRR